MPDFIKVMKNAYRKTSVVETPKRILLLTMRHTGSFFFADILAKQYFNWKPTMFHFNATRLNTEFPGVSSENAKYPITLPEEFNPFVRIHTEWESACIEFMSRFKDNEKPIVITLERDLNKVKESYIRRASLRTPLAFDENISIQIGELAFNEHYKHHLSVLKKIKPDFTLSVDAADKEERLNNLASTLGVPLSTDWVPINRTTPAE